MSKTEKECESKKKKWKMRNTAKNKYLNWKKKIKRNVKIDWKEKEIWLFPEKEIVNKQLKTIVGFSNST